jgi:hypothetical protein
MFLNTVLYLLCPVLDVSGSAAVCSGQCCGSGCAWIRIDLAFLDPDPYWELGSRSRSKKIDQIKQINLISSLPTFVCFLTYYPHEVYFFLVKSNFLRW